MSTINEIGELITALKTTDEEKTQIQAEINELNEKLAVLESDYLAITAVLKEAASDL